MSNVDTIVLNKCLKMLFTSDAHNLLNKNTKLSHRNINVNTKLAKNASWSKQFKNKQTLL